MGLVPTARPVSTREKKFITVFVTYRGISHARGDRLYDEMSDRRNHKKYIYIQSIYRYVAHMLVR